MSSRSMASTSRTVQDNSPLVSAPLNELIARKRRREKRRFERKRVISSGLKSNLLTGVSFAAAILFCFSHFEHLQREADYKLFEFDSLPIQVKHVILPGIVGYGHWISAAMFFLQILAIKFSKTRFTFPCLLALFAWPILVFLHYEQNHHRDYLISRLALSVFTLLNATAILFLPKKLKKRKRPNTFYSAFSIASTPTSQQSSQLNQSQCSWMSSMHNDGQFQPRQRTVDFDDGASLFSQRTRKSLATTTNESIRQRASTNWGYADSQSNSMFDTMTLRSGRTMSKGSPSVFSLATTTKPERMSYRERREEQTPMREVRQLIDDLLIQSTDDEDSASAADDDCSIGSSKTMKSGAVKMPAKMLTPGAISPSRTRKPHQAPFASLTYNPAVRKRAHAIANSREGGFSTLKGRNSANTHTSLSYGGTSCSSLSASSGTYYAASSPFGGHL